MGAKYSRLIALAIVISWACTPAFSANTNGKPAHKHLVTKQQPPPAPEPTAPVIPLQPLNLDQMPASPPQVSFSNGQLTIVAPNSTLGEILRAVKTQTGAVIEMPGNPNDRVVGHMGPGPARDVLASLLNGTRFNYVLLGSATNPDGLAHIILIAKSGGGGEPVQQANAQLPQSVPPQPGPPGGGGPQVQQAGTDEADDADADATDQQGAPDDQGDQADQQNQQNQAKSPEQLLQELQRQQQIQQQLGQQPGGPGGPRFPGLPQQPPAQQPEQ